MMDEIEDLPDIENYTFISNEFQQDEDYDFFQSNNLKRTCEEPSGFSKKQKSSKSKTALEREEIKKQKEIEKQQKQQEKLALKAFKPGEAIKYMIVEIDRKALEMPHGSDILNSLREAEIVYRVVDNSVSESIRYLRKDVLTNMEKQEDNATVIIGVNEFVLLVYNQINGLSERNLLNQCRKWKQNLGTNKVFMIVCGLDDYFQKDKKDSRKQHRNAILQKGKLPATANQVKVSRMDVDTVLISANFEEKIDYRLAETSSSVGKIICQVTKAISEAPFKNMKSQFAGFSFCTDDTKNKCVKIDKSGVGLLKLWHQQLRQFNNVGIEVSQAIVSKYNSPQQLCQAYKLMSEKDGMVLLADIPIRRGNGPLTTSRRIGPELSKRIYKFFTSKDGNESL